MSQLSEFEKAILAYQEIEQAQAQAVPRSQWRVYYQGNRPLHLAFGPDWPDYDLPYLDITSEQAGDIYSYRVEMGRLIKIDNTRSNVVKLKKDLEGPYYAMSENMALLLEANENHEHITRYTKDYG